MFKFILYLILISYYVGQFTGSNYRIIIHSSTVLLSLGFNIYYILILKKGKLRNTGGIDFFLIYILFCFVSLFWSENYLETIFQSIYILTLYFNIKFFHENNKIKSVTYYLSFSILLEFLLILVRKTGLELNIFQLFHGVGSIQALISVFILYPLKSNSTILCKSIYVFNLLVLILSSSGKIYLALIAIFIYHFYTQGKYVSKLIIGLTLSSMITYLIKMWSFYDFGKLEHLGGRLLPWKIMIEKIIASPGLGYGFPFGDEIYIDSTFTISNAHNLFIGSTLYIGFLGPVLLFLFFVKAFKKSKNMLFIRYLIIGVFISSMFNISISGKLNIPLIATLLILTYTFNLKYVKN
jgi:hypothetical protein